MVSTISKINVRHDFPILTNIIFLDNSSTTQKPRQVIDAIKKYYEEENANVHRGIYALSLKATMAYEKAHELVARFINAKFEEIIFTSGTTESINLLAYSLGKRLPWRKEGNEGKQLQPGDEIILTEMEHHSNLVPWQQLAKEKGCVLKYIPLTEDFRLDMRKAQEFITPKTKIVAVTQMSNVLGTVNPVQEIAALTHENGAPGALCIVDAAQSVPHLPVDVKALGCDFLAFSGHKMLGPTGIGVLYGKKELLENMKPFHYGGGMIKEVSWNESSWNDLPWKFEAGTPNISGAIGLAAAIKYLQGIGMENIWRQEEELVKHILAKLSEIPGARLLGPSSPEQRGAIFSFVLENMHPHDISELLDKENICVRAGHHCAMPLHTKFGLTGSVRASFYLYNTKEEADLFLQELAQMAAAKTINPYEIAVGELTEEQELHKENVLDHYKNPRNKGMLAEYTVTHREHNPLCGDELQCYMLLNHTLLKDISFTGEGCAISQASASLLTEKVKGMALENVRKLAPWNIYNLLGIPISHARSKCALLALKTVQRGLEHH